MEYFWGIFYSFTHLMNYDEGPGPDPLLVGPDTQFPSSHGIEISTLFDFIELFLLTFASVAIYCPFGQKEEVFVSSCLNDNFPFAEAPGRWAQMFGNCKGAALKLWALFMHISPANKGGTPT